MNSLETSAHNGIAFPHPLSFYSNIGLSDVRAISRSVPSGAKVVGPSSSEKTSGAIAVLPFENTVGVKNYEWLTTGIMNVLMTELASSDRLTVIDRSQIHACLKEIEFSLSDLAAPSSAKRVGKFLSADYLLTGDFQIVDQTLLINARLIESETSAVKFSGNVTTSVDSRLFSAQKNLADTILAKVGNAADRGARDSTRKEKREEEISVEALREYETAYQDYVSGKLPAAITRLKALIPVVPNYMPATVLLIGTLMEYGEINEALNTANERLKKLDSATKDSHRDRAVLLIAIGGTELYSARTAELNGAGRGVMQNHLDAAYAAFRRVLTIIDEVKDEDLSALKGRLMESLGVYETLRVDFLGERSRTPFIKAYSFMTLESYIPTFGYESMQSLQSLLSIGRAYTVDGVSEKARSFFSEIIRVVEKNGLQTTGVYNRALQFMGMDYMKNGDKAMARKYLSEAYEIKKRLYGPNATDMLRIRKWLDSLTP